MSQERPAGGQSSQLRSQPGRESTQAKSPQARSGSQPATADGRERSKERQEQAAEISKKHPSPSSREARTKEAEKKHLNRPAARDHHRLSDAPDTTLVGLLKTADGKLQAADHDYAGHRVKAMEHIHAAVALLGSSLGIAMGGFGSGSGNLPQQRSDEMLREALHHLNMVEGSLASGANRVARHHRARASVAEAIREVRTALEVR
jgi:hypothetical protein